MPIRPQRNVPAPEQEAAKIVKTFLYAVTTSTGDYVELNFLDGSIEYFGDRLKNGFKHLLIDNVGSGKIRISLRPNIEMSSPVIGAKTIEGQGSLFIEDDVYYIRIYFVNSSTVELVGIYE